MHEGTGDRRDADIGYHFDGEGRAQHRSRIGARKLIGQQPERHGGEAGAKQRQQLCREQMPVGRVGKRAEHQIIVPRQTGSSLSNAWHEAVVVVA